MKRDDITMNVKPTQLKNNLVTIDLSAYKRSARGTTVNGYKHRVTLPRDKPPNGWPSPMNDDAYHGLVGDIVRLTEPHTEGDVQGLLVSHLVMFGNSIGRSAYFEHEETKHYANEFSVICGETSKARKGTILDRVKGMYLRSTNLSTRNDDWFSRIKDGLSSGEGLIAQFVDPKPDKDGAIPPVTTDKRLMITEGEFARILIAAGRSGNTLSPILRNAWDHGNLSILTRHDPLEAEGAHLSIIAHITMEELKRYSNVIQSPDGFGNRFLWLATRRSKMLPQGGGALKDEHLLKRLIAAQDYARTVGRMTRSERCSKLWDEVYEHVGRDQYGIAGALCNRGEPHVTRLSMIYALLDKSKVIQEKHLKAALEVWRYCEDSVKHIFGDAMGDYVADTIDRAMRERREMGRLQISQLFSHNQPASEINRGLELLEKMGRVRRKSTLSRGKGRPAEIWEYVT